MPGFCGIIGDNEIKINTNEDLVNDLIVEDNFVLLRYTINKFLNDKIFQNSNNYTIVLEGVIFNSKELFRLYKSKTMADVMICMYEKNGETFMSELRGSFSGFLFDKERKVKILFTNHIGDKRIFYTSERNMFMFSSDLNTLSKLRIQKKITNRLDINCAYELLSLSFTLEDSTVIENVKMLKAGSYLLINNDQDVTCKQYFTLKNIQNNNDSEDTIIDNINTLFRTALKRALDKDAEYGYKHLISLSGGLDSRMTTVVANDMGYGEDIINYTFAQYGSLDESIPAKISADLKHEWIYKSLDNGTYLKDIDKYVRAQNANSNYSGSAHTYNFLEKIDKNMFGIVHTGQLGDVMISSAYGDDTLDEVKGVPNIGNSTKLLGKVKYNTIDNKELCFLKNRGFIAVFNGNVVIQEHFESSSPFCDIDLMTYCLSIPVKLRKSHNIYNKWINRYYPVAARYIWAQTGTNINKNPIAFLGKSIYLNQLFRKIKRRVMMRIGKVKKGEILDGMNPMDYWYKTNPQLKKSLDDYYNNEMKSIRDSSIKEDIKFLFNTGNVVEKHQVVTLLSALKQFNIIC